MPQDEHLSPHFLRSEFELDGPMPDECVEPYTILCTSVLEIIRAHFSDWPIYITSGYRDAEANKKAGGVADSQHIATANWCAADFHIEAYVRDMRPVFDWVRKYSNLDWDETILEHDPKTGQDIIHVSWTKTTPRLIALEGDVANESAYISWEVSSNRSGVATPTPA